MNSGVTRFLLALGVCGSVAALWGQQTPPGLTARELFYTPPPQTPLPARTTPAAVPPVTQKRTTPTATTASRHTPRRQSSPEVRHESATEIETPKASTEMASQTSPASGPSTTPAAVITNVAHVSTMPLAMKYSVLRRDNSGEYVQVDPDTIFHAGDKVKVRVESNDDAFLYVLARGSSGKWQTLFPDAEINGGDNRILRNREMDIPPPRIGRFSIDGTPGDERLFVVLTRQSEPDLEKLIYKMVSNDETTAPKPLPAAEKLPGTTMIASGRTVINDDLIGRAKNGLLARDLVFEKVDDVQPGPTGQREKAVYIANAKGGDGAEVVAEVTLRKQ